MKQNEIRVGGKYKMKVSGTVQTVRVDRIEERTNYKGRTMVSYVCTNLATGRECMAHSAAKFRVAEPAPGWPLDYDEFMAEFNRQTTTKKQLTDEQRESAIVNATKLTTVEEITYTTAPVDYDGFGTETLEIIGTWDGGLSSGFVRRVSTPSEHITWQRARYESGCYLSCDRVTWAERMACSAMFTPARQELAK